MPGRIDRVDDAGWVDVFGQHGDATPAHVTAHLNDSAHKHCTEDGVEATSREDSPLTQCLSQARGSRRAAIRRCLSGSLIIHERKALLVYGMASRRIGQSANRQ